MREERMPGVPGAERCAMYEEERTCAGRVAVVKWDSVRVLVVRGEMECVKFRAAVERREWWREGTVDMMAREGLWFHRYGEYA